MLVDNLIGKTSTLADIDIAQKTHLKCDPATAIQPRALYADALPGYHINKDRCNTYAQEDTPMLLPHIEAVFGAETAKIVDVLTHLQSQGDSPYKIKLSHEEKLQMFSRIGNTRALYVKIADRLYNMRTIYAKPYERQLHRAQVTLDLFVPLAERLGLKEAAEELTSRCKEVLSSSPQTSSMVT